MRDWEGDLPSGEGASGMSGFRRGQKRLRDSGETRKFLGPEIRGREMRHREISGRTDGAAL